LVGREYQKANILYFSGFDVDTFLTTKISTSTILGTGIANRLHKRGGSFLVRVKRFISSPKVSREALGPAQPLIQWEQGAISLGLNRQRREADHLPPSMAVVKECCCTSIPPYAFMVVQGELTVNNFNRMHYKLQRNRPCAYFYH
jgi:hypothetical protein